MNRLHPVTFIGGIAAEGLPKRVWGYRKFRYLFEDHDDGRHVFKYRRARRGIEYHFIEEYVVALDNDDLPEEDFDSCSFP